MVAILEGKIVLSQWRLPFNMAAITMEKVNNARPLYNYIRTFTHCHICMSNTHTHTIAHTHTLASMSSPTSSTNQHKSPRRQLIGQRTSTASSSYTMASTSVVTWTRVRNWYSSWRTTAPSRERLSAAVRTWYRSGSGLCMLVMDTGNRNGTQ